MIRLLAITAGVSLLIAGVGIGGAVGLGGKEFAEKGFVFHPHHGRWTFGDGSGPIIDWTGPTTTKTVAWSGAEALDITVPAQIAYTQGPIASITLTGPKDVVEGMIVEGGRIGLPGRSDVAFGGKHEEGQKLRIVIVAPKVTAFTLNTAAELGIAGYDQESLSVEVNGAAEVHAKGRAKRLEIEMNGASAANLGDFTVEDAKVEINGAGRATINATGSVDVEINGAGAVKLASEPQHLSSEINGLGKVERPSQVKAEPATKKSSGKG